MIRVKDLPKSLSFYESMFDMKPCHRLDFPSFSLVYLKNQESAFEIELTFNVAQGEEYSHGTGYGHIAFVCDDISATHRKAIELGYEPADIKEFHDEEKKELLAKFFFLKDPDGYKIEVLQQHGHYQ